MYLQETNGNTGPGPSISSFLCNVLLCAKKEENTNDCFTLSRLQCQRVLSYRLEDATQEEYSDQEDSNIDYSPVVNSDGENTALEKSMANMSLDGDTQSSKDKATGLIMNCQTEIVDTDTNQMNVTEAIKAIVKNDKQHKVIKY